MSYARCGIVTWCANAIVRGCLCWIAQTGWGMTVVSTGSRLLDRKLDRISSPGCHVRVWGQTANLQPHSVLQHQTVPSYKMNAAPAMSDAELRTKADST